MRALPLLPLLDLLVGVSAPSLLTGPEHRWLQLPPAAAVGVAVGAGLIALVMRPPRPRDRMAVHLIAAALLVNGSTALLRGAPFDYLPLPLGFRGNVADICIIGSIAWISAGALRKPALWPAMLKRRKST